MQSGQGRPDIVEKFGDGLFSSQVHPYKQSDIGGEGVCRCRDPRCSRVHFLNEDGTAGPWEVPAPTLLETVFRHGGWSVDRSRVITALREAGVSEKRVNRFTACGAACCVEFNAETRSYRTRGFYCGDRFCRPCSRARARRSRSAIAELVGNQRCRLVTFTRKSRSESLIDALNHLYESFKKVRRADAFKNHIAAGLAVTEIKRGAGSGEWHVHIHCLTIGPGMIPWKPLSDAWYLATGDSFVVDLREVKSDRGIGYVLKYLGKGFDQSVLRDPDDLAECVTALRGRRMLSAFGAWFGRVSDAEPEPEGEWKLVGSLHGIVAAADRGEEWAKGVMMNLRGGKADDAPPMLEPPWWRDRN